MYFIDRRHSFGTLSVGGFTITNLLSPQAYKNWLKKHKEEKDFPKTGLSHDQLFYLSFAHVMNSRLLMCLSPLSSTLLQFFFLSIQSLFPLFTELGMTNVSGRSRTLFRKLKFTYRAPNLLWISKLTKGLSAKISFTKLWNLPKLSCSRQVVSGKACFIDSFWVLFCCCEKSYTWKVEFYWKRHVSLHPFLHPPLCHVE